MPIRIRQHVNPLARKFQQPLAIPNWQEIYSHSDKPTLKDTATHNGQGLRLDARQRAKTRSVCAWQRDLHLDIGCARGKFLQEMALANPQTNFLGIEIRQSLVTAANQMRDELNLTNLHYLFGNINSSAEVLLQSLPANTLKTISVQFPDPWFKKRHNKRRVVQPKLVEILIDYLAEEGKVFLQSDIEEVAIEMRDRFAVSPLLTTQHSTTWLDTNPLGVPTERELYVLEQNLPVYRVMFQKLAVSNQ